MRLGLALLAWPAGFAALHLAGHAPDLVERWYSRGLYPRVGAGLRAVAGLAPVSLSELLIAALGVGLLLRAARAWRRLRGGEARLGQLTASAGRSALHASAGLWVAFLVLWGFSHARRPYAWHVGLELSEVRTGELRDMTRWLGAEATRLRAEVREEDLALRDGPGGVDPRLARAYELLGERVPALAGGSLLLRRPLSAPLLSALGISGIFSPFTGEAHVNDQTRTWLHLFAAAHELAHQKGFAREDEANWIAWQVCRGSGDPALAYSVTLVALRFAVAALAEEDPGAARAVVEGLSEGVLEDLEANRRFWSERRTVLTDVAVDVNDTYLRSTGSEEGVRSYGRMLDGLVAERRAELGGGGGGAP